MLIPGRSHSHTCTRLHTYNITFCLCTHNPCMCTHKLCRLVPACAHTHRGCRDGGRAPFPSKNHAETFSESHAHGIFIWGLFLGTFNNLWLGIPRPRPQASFLAPSLTDRRSAPRHNPGLSGPSRGWSRSLQLGAPWHRKRGPLRFPPQFPPRGPAPCPP